MRSVIYHINYFAIFVLCVTMMTMSLLAFALLHEPSMQKQLMATAQSTAGVPVSVRDIQYDETSRVVTISGVTIENPEGFPAGPAMTIGRITLEIDYEDTGKHLVWGKTGRKYILNLAKVDDVRVFLLVQRNSTNISTLIKGLELAASAQYHTKPGRPPVKIVLNNIFAPKEFGLVTEDGEVTLVPCGDLKELAKINREGGALASEGMGGVIQAFGRAALNQAAQRKLLTGLSPKGLAEITESLDATEQMQSRMKDAARKTFKRFVYMFGTL